MATKSKEWDMGGLNLHVNELYTGATKHGATGSKLSEALSTAELTITGGADDIVVDGTVAAAGTGSGSAGNTGGAVATNVLTITVGGVSYYIPLCNTNA